MESTIEKDLIYLTQGNPGAITVITSNEFMRYTERHRNIKYMIVNGIIGSKIREQAKDVYKNDLLKYAKDIDEKASKWENKKKYIYQITGRSEHDINSPLFIPRYISDKPGQPETRTDGSEMDD